MLYRNYKGHIIQGETKEEIENIKKLIDKGIDNLVQFKESGLIEKETPCLSKQKVKETINRLLNREKEVCLNRKIPYEDSSCRILEELKGELKL